MLIRTRPAFLLDLDGTLVDPGPGILGCCRQTLAALGASPPEEEDLRWVIGPPIRETFRRLLNVAGAAPGRTEQPRVHRDFPAGWTDLIPELNRQPRDHVVTKHTPGAFTDTGLEAHLRGLGVTQVVVVGVATSNGVEVTARQAYELGFNVTFATDAMTDPQADAHAWTIARVFPRIGETGATRDILELLERVA